MGRVCSVSTAKAIEHRAKCFPSDLDHSMHTASSMLVTDGEIDASIECVTKRVTRDLTNAEAAELAKRSIFHATYRDTASGGTISIYLITKDGWTKLSGTDVDDLYEQYTTDRPDVSFE